MHMKCTETLRDRLERDGHAINILLADPTTDDLVLVNYGAGWAWLRREAGQPVPKVQGQTRDPNPAEPEDALWILTPSGHDLVAVLRAQEALFGADWPTVAEAR